MIQIDDLSSLEQIRQVQLFLLDLDGTVYLEDELISGVQEFISNLQRNKIPYVFLTNNSSRNADQYIEKLSSMGIKTVNDNVLTSGTATGYYLSKIQKKLRLYVIGTMALIKELESWGHTVCQNTEDAVDYIITGFDTELTYEKIRSACTFIENGAGFIATNPDLVCPVKNKHYIPDCGSICKMIENATGKQPIFIGKPHTTMIEIVKSRFGVAASKMAIVGDRLYTDIALGCNAGIYTICVLSGESTFDQIAQSSYLPQSVISSINFLNLAFKK